MPIQAFLLSLVVILVTEFGDKTMLTTMCLSAQYQRPIIVLAATLLALTFTTLIGVIIGVILSASLPLDIIVYLSGALFLFLGVYSLVKSKSEGVDSCENPATFISMVSLVLLSELGDKSQIAILAVAAGSPFPVMVFLGAIIGFFILNLIAIIVGDRLSRITSMNNVRIVTGLMFIAFGIAVLLGVF